MNEEQWGDMKGLAPSIIKRGGQDGIKI